MISSPGFSCLDFLASFVLPSPLMHTAAQLWQVFGCFSKFIFHYTYFFQKDSIIFDAVFSHTHVHFLYNGNISHLQVHHRLSLFFAENLRLLYKPATDNLCTKTQEEKSQRRRGGGPCTWRSPCGTAHPNLCKAACFFLSLFKTRLTLTRFSINLKNIIMYIILYIIINPNQLMQVVQTCSNN